MRGLFPWAGVSDEDGFVRRTERIWRLGTAGFGTPENMGLPRLLEQLAADQRAADLARSSNPIHADIPVSVLGIQRSAGISDADEEFLTLAKFHVHRLG